MTVNHPRRLFALVMLLITVLLTMFPAGAKNASVRDFVKLAENAGANDAEALQYYQQGAAAYPDDGFFYARLGQHYYKRLRDYRRAVENYRIALSKDFRLEWMVLQLVNALAILAEAELGAGNWKQADVYLKEAVANNTTAKFTSLASKERMLSEYLLSGNPANAFRHKMLIVFVPEIRTGNRQIDGVLQAADIQNSKVALTGFGRYLEALSGGNLAVAFDFVTLDRPVTKLKTGPKGEYMLDLEMLSQSSPELTPHIGNHDTFLFVWPAGSFVPARAGGGKLSGTWRGVMQVPAMRMALDSQSLPGPSLLLHEFFHVLERLAGIKPEHGFEKNLRKNFPEWKGNNEFDYYEWQLNSTVARVGWPQMNFVDRFPVQ